MRPHHVHQPGQLHITTPTGSILNVYIGYLHILDPQQWSFPLFLQMKIFCYKQQSSVYLVVIYCISINYIFCASGVALAILLLKK